MSHGETPAPQAPQGRAARAAILVWLLALLWMAAIFCFSAQTGAASQAQSDGIGYRVLRWVDASFVSLPPAQQAARVEDLQGLIRKGAHLAEYALLGALLWGALYCTARWNSVAAQAAANAAVGTAAASPDISATGTNATGTKISATERSATAVSAAFRCALAALLLGAVYAATDEWHQSFVPGRSPQASDVLIDALGVALGIALCLLAHTVRDRAARRPQSGPAAARISASKRVRNSAANSTQEPHNKQTKRQG